MKKTLTIATTMLLALVLSMPATARERKDRFEKSRRAIAEAGIDVSKATVVRDQRRGEMLQIKSRTDARKIVKRFRKLHQVGTRLNGARVVGLAHMTHSDSWNITLRIGNQLTVVNVKDTPRGSRLLVRKSMRIPVARR